jgi:hypothetical protein
MTIPETRNLLASAKGGPASAVVDDDRYRSVPARPKTGFHWWDGRSGSGDNAPTNKVVAANSKKSAPILMLRLRPSGYEVHLFATHPPRPRILRFDGAGEGMATPQLRADRIPTTGVRTTTGVSQVALNVGNLEESHGFLTEVISGDEFYGRRALPVPGSDSA